MLKRHVTIGAMDQQRGRAPGASQKQHVGQQLFTGCFRSGPREDF
jgi:hypothetical protein